MAEGSTQPVDTAQSRYTQLEPFREPYLSKAREAASLTLPSLMPRSDPPSPTTLDIPWQSLGSRGVNHLAAKLLLALFPPGTSFFRLSLDDFALSELAKKASADEQTARAEFDEALGKVERAVTNRLEQKGHRSTLFESLRQLIVVGNILLEVTPGGKLRYHKLDRYVVKRDREGNVIELIVKESLSPVTLPEKAKAIYEQERSEEDKKKDESIDIFTRIVREDSKWTISQEICGKQIADSEGTYPIEKSPWLVLRWSKLDGEDYGLGHVWDYIGDLKTVEALERSIVQFAGAASKVIVFVKENGITSRKVVAEAASGATVEGDADDVSVFQLDKFSDFTVCKTVKDDKDARLQQAFLLVSGLPRDAERVTAEEIRALINELEQALGGVYSVLAEELQAPLVRRVMLQMQREKALPHLPEGMVQAQIITGMEALGRITELRRLDELIAGLSELFGPEVVEERIDPTDYLKRRATALSIDTKGLVRTPAEVDQIKKDKAQQTMNQTIAPHVAKAASDMVSQPQQEGV